MSGEKKRERDSLCLLRGRGGGKKKKRHLTTTDKQIDYKPRTFDWRKEGGKKMGAKILAEGKKREKNIGHFGEPGHAYRRKKNRQCHERKEELEKSCSRNVTAPEKKKEERKRKKKLRSFARGGRRGGEWYQKRSARKCKNCSRPGREEKAQVVRKFLGKGGRTQSNNASKCYAGVGRASDFRGEGERKGIENLVES